MNPKAFIVVGHRDWGKTRTLQALKKTLSPSQGSRQVVIGNERFFVREMSNDDKPDQWVAFVERLNPKNKRHVILAACPKENAIPYFIDLKQRGYELVFWVIRHRCDEKRPRSMTSVEENCFRDLGAVEFCSQPATENERARQLKEFVESYCEQASSKWEESK